MRRYPKQSRTIPIKAHPDHGDGKDVGKYFRCWNCGFICNIEKNELGGPESRNKITIQRYTQVDEYGNTTTGTRYKPIMETGCPLCGTLNWRGDY